MLTVTERAKTYLKESVLSKIETPGVSARLGQTAPGQLSLLSDTGEEGDQVVEYQGATVLLIDGELSGRFAGALIDCVESPRGLELTIRGNREPGAIPALARAPDRAIGSDFGTARTGGAPNAVTRSRRGEYVPSRRPPCASGARNGSSRSRRVRDGARLLR